MNILRHGDQPREEWRPGVATRMRVSAVVGAKELCIFEQWCAPGTGAPPHTHPVEEVLTVLAGRMQLRLAGEQGTLTAGQSIIVPPEVEHGFSNAGTCDLHVLVAFAAPHFEASYRGETTARWRGEAEHD